MPGAGAAGDESLDLAGEAVAVQRPQRRGGGIFAGHGEPIVERGGGSMRRAGIAVEAVEGLGADGPPQPRQRGETRRKRRRTPRRRRFAPRAAAPATGRARTRRGTARRPSPPTPAAARTARRRSPPRRGAPAPSASRRGASPRRAANSPPASNPSASSAPSARRSAPATLASRCNHGGILSRPINSA